MLFRIKLAVFRFVIFNGKTLGGGKARALLQYLEEK